MTTPPPPPPPSLDGFRKVAKPDQGSLAKCMENESVEFWHMNFRRGHPELLYLVQRRVSNLGSDSRVRQ